MKKIILLLMIFVLIPIGLATDYYFSSSEGNDSNNCLSELTPCKTITKLNTISLSAGDKVLFKRGDTWRTTEDAYPLIRSGNASGRITFTAYGNGEMPKFYGSYNLSSVLNWTPSNMGENIWNATFQYDWAIANIVFNDSFTGLLRQSFSLLDSQGKFLANNSAKVLQIYSVGNPALIYSSIEAVDTNQYTHSSGAALFYIKNHDYLNFNNLDVRYNQGCFESNEGTANQINISYTNCMWAGGTASSTMTRAGNGIGFGLSSTNIYVGYNNVSQVYDAGISPQAWSSGGTRQIINHTYEYNIVDTSAYGWEYFSALATSTTSNILIQQNTFVNSGRGWGSVEGNDGRTLRLARSVGTTTNFTIINNIFSNSAKYEIDFLGTNIWNGDITFSNNLWYQNANVFAVWNNTPVRTYYSRDSWASAENQDIGGLNADPLLDSNYRPQAGSLACNMSSTGSYVGALPCAEDTTIPMKISSGAVFKINGINHTYTTKTNLSDLTRTLSFESDLEGFENGEVSSTWSSVGSNSLRLFRTSGVKTFNTDKITIDIKGEDLHGGRLIIYQGLISTGTKYNSGWIYDEVNNIEVNITPNEPVRFMSDYNIVNPREVIYIDTIRYEEELSSLVANASGIFINNRSVAKIENKNLSLKDLKAGKQKYDLHLNLSSGIFNSDSCYLRAQGSYTSDSASFSSNSCLLEFYLAQSSSNEFYAFAEDEYFNIKDLVSFKGVEVTLDEDNIYADTSLTSNLDSQYFLRSYSLNNHIGGSFSNISFEGASGYVEKIVDVPSGVSVVNGSFVGGFITPESHIIAGDEFNISEGYQVVRYLMYNNTLDKSLPNISLAVELDHYDTSNLYTEVIEKQSGLSWNAVNSTYSDALGNETGSFAVVSLEGLSPSSSQYYRYSYDALLASFSGETDADNRLSGDYKEWTLDRNYNSHFDLSGKNLHGSVGVENLGEWLSKISVVSSTLLSPNGSLKTHTSTYDNDSFSFSFSDAPLGAYPFQLKYYSPVSSSSTPSGGGGTTTNTTTSSGGGGGGGGIVIINNQTSIDNQTIEDLISKTLSVGKVRYVPTNIHTISINYLPENVYYKEFVIEAYEGDVVLNLQFSDNLKPYFTGAICDLRTSDCFDSIVLKDGEQKYFYVEGQVQEEVFHELIKEEGLIEGYIFMTKSENDVFFLNIEKSSIFDKVMVVHEDLTGRGFDLTTKEVYQLFLISAFSLIMIVIIGYAYYARYI